MTTDATLAQQLCESSVSFAGQLVLQKDTMNGHAYGSTPLGIPPFAGCLFTDDGDALSSGAITQDTHPLADTTHSWFLVHFGAILAVNAKAHALLPQLPWANAAEVTAIDKATQRFGNGS